jgi:hypothetical protein
LPIRLRGHAAEDDLLAVIVADLSKHHLERTESTMPNNDASRRARTFLSGRFDRQCEHTRRWRQYSSAWA